MPLFIAYRVTCLVNGKVYIGVTKRTLQERWADHLDAAKYNLLATRKLCRAIRKYGFDQFLPETVACARSSANILAVERLLINQYDSVRHGYNMTHGGEGTLGLERVFTPAMRRNMSVAHLSDQALSRLRALGYDSPQDERDAIERLRSESYSISECLDIFKCSYRGFRALVKHHKLYPLVGKRTYARYSKSQIEELNRPFLSSYSPSEAMSVLGIADGRFRHFLRRNQVHSMPGVVGVRYPRAEIDRLAGYSHPNLSYSPHECRALLNLSQTECSKVFRRAGITTIAGSYRYRKAEVDSFLARRRGRNGR